MGHLWDIPPFMIGIFAPSTFPGIAQQGRSYR